MNGNLRWKNWAKKYLIELTKNDAMVEIKDLDIRQKWQYYALPHLLTQSLKGDHILNKLLKALDLLDSVGYKRSEQQIEFHNYFIGACLSLIYGSELPENLERLKLELKLLSIKKSIALLPPRRYGKTTSIALFVAACLYAFPEITIFVYSVAKRISVVFKKLVEEIFLALPSPKGGHQIKENNQETFSIISHSGLTSTVHCYPSNERISFFYFISFFFFSFFPPKEKKNPFFLKIDRPMMKDIVCQIYSFCLVQFPFFSSQKIDNRNWDIRKRNR